MIFAKFMIKLACLEALLRHSLAAFTRQASETLW